MNIIKKIKDWAFIIIQTAMLILILIILLILFNILETNSTTLIIALVLIGIALFFNFFIETKSWLNAIKTPRTKNLYGGIFLNYLLTSTNPPI